MRVGASWLFAPAREPFQHNILICERRDERNYCDDRDSNSRSLLETVTTNATRLTLVSPFLRRTVVRVTTGTSTRRGGESGCDSDITQCGEVGVGEKAARAGHRRCRHRCAPCLSHASAACSLGGHSGARWRRGGTVSPRQVRLPRCRCAGAAPAASLYSLRTHVPGTWCVLSARRLRWCDAGGSDGWSEQRCRVAAALFTAPQRPAGSLACSRVMPRALWCGLGRGVDYAAVPLVRERLWSRRGGGGGSAEPTEASWALGVGVVSSRWASRPTRRGSGDLARSPAAAYAAWGGGGSRFIGAPAVWQQLRWCWQ